MWVTVNGTNSTEIEDSVVERVLNLYPEEQLSKRKVFQKAFAGGVIKLSDLKEECDKLLIPWQMFFLDKTNHKKQIEHIEKTRADKVSASLLAKRKGAGDVTSKRIIDRLIRLQSFVSENTTLPNNSFCDSLKGMRVEEAAKQLILHFLIDQPWFWDSRGKGVALTRLIKLVESKSINLSQGVLQNKMLPHHSVVKGDLYKNTSGFAIKDNKVPFLFLPSEINPDEVESRQIFTLIYLLVIVGLGEYKYFLEKDFTAKVLVGGDRMSRRIFDITTEVLIPNSETDKLRGKKITLSLRDELASKFKVSPSALVTTLRIRKVITKAEYDVLKPEKYKPGTRTSGPMRPQKISTSVQKFCGTVAITHVNNGIRTEAIGNIRAQYLLLGAVNKPNFHKYRSEIGL